MYPPKVEEQIEKARHAQGCAQTTSGNIGSAKPDYDRPARPSLRERIEDIKRRSEDSERKGNRAAELGYLLDTNPEVARILDLLEDL